MGDQCLLERLNHLIDDFVNSQSADQHRQKEDIHEAWQYGILWDRLLKAGRVTGRKALHDQIRDEAAALLHWETEWNIENHRLRDDPQLTFLLAQGFATIDQEHRDVKYQNLGIACFTSFENENLTLEEPGIFGLLVGEAEKLVSLLEFRRLNTQQEGKIEP